MFYSWLLLGDYLLLGQPQSELSLTISFCCLDILPKYMTQVTHNRLKPHKTVSQIVSYSPYIVFLSYLGHRNVKIINRPGDTFSVSGNILLVTLFVAAFYLNPLMFMTFLSVFPE